MFDTYKDMLNIDDVIEILEIGRNTAYDLLRSHQICGFQIGTNWKIPKVALENYVNEQMELAKIKLSKEATPSIYFINSLGKFISENEHDEIEKSENNCKVLQI